MVKTKFNPPPKNPDLPSGSPSGEPKGRIVEGVGAASKLLGGGHPGLADRIRQAMENAIKKAYREGITDPVQIKARMMTARHQAKLDG